MILPVSRARSCAVRVSAQRRNESRAGFVSQHKIPVVPSHVYSRFWRTLQPALFDQYVYHSEVFDSGGVPISRMLDSFRKIGVSSGKARVGQAFSISPLKFP